VTCTNTQTFTNRQTNKQIGLESCCATKKLTALCVIYHRQCRWTWVRSAAASRMTASTQQYRKHIGTCCCFVNCYIVPAVAAKIVFLSVTPHSLTLWRYQEVRSRALAGSSGLSFHPPTVPTTYWYLLLLCYVYCSCRSGRNYLSLYDYHALSNLLQF